MPTLCLVSTLRSNHASALVAAILVIGPVTVATAQDYPNRPVRLIVASSPGAGVDIVARLVAQRMTDAIGAQMVVDNRAGAGGAIGVQVAARSAPDGYTLLMAAPSLTINAILVRPPPYDAIRDFAAVGQATTAPYIVVVHPSLPVRNLKELIVLAKTHPGRLNYGSGGPGNSTHLNVEYFRSLAKVDFVHVPYKGSGPAVVDLLGGHIELMFANLVAVLPQVKSGKLRGLATTGAARSAALPNVPTVIEAGVPGYVVTSWFGILAPSRTPQEIIAKLNAALVSVMRERDLMEKVAAEGAEPAPGTPDAFARLLASELATWGTVIKAAGLQ